MHLGLLHLLIHCSVYKVCINCDHFSFKNNMRTRACAVKGQKYFQLNTPCAKTCQASYKKDTYQIMCMH